MIEIILNSKLFLLSPHVLNLINCSKYLLSPHLLNLVICSKNLPRIIFKFSLYLFKLIVEDYLRTDNFTKNSVILLNRSREIRKLENTF